MTLACHDRRSGRPRTRRLRRRSPACASSTWPTRRARRAVASSPTSAPTSSASSRPAAPARAACPSRSPSATRTSAASRSTSRPSRERLLSLLESADVWIETTRPGTLAALGLGPEDVLARNPELVITSITDFGQTGDYRHWQANDLDPRGDERHPEPLRAGRARPPPRPARDGDGDDGDPGGVGDARRLLEPARDRPRGSRRLLDPRGGDADHGPRLRHRLGQPRVRLPLDPRASGGRSLPDLPVRRRPRARGRARAAPVAGDARLARRARGLPGRAVRRDPGAARGVGRAARALRRAVRRHDEGRDRGRGPGPRRAGRARPRGR